MNQPSRPNHQLSPTTTLSSLSKDSEYFFSAFFLLLRMIVFTVFGGTGTTLQLAWQGFIGTTSACCFGCNWDWLVACGSTDELGVSILELSYCEDGENMAFTKKAKNSPVINHGRNLVYDPYQLLPSTTKTPPKPSQKTLLKGEESPIFLIEIWFGSFISRNSFSNICIYFYPFKGMQFERTNFELGKIWGFNCFIMSLLFPKGGKAPNELPSWVCRFDDGCCVLTCFFCQLTKHGGIHQDPSQDGINIWLFFFKHVDKSPCHWWLRPSRFWNHCMWDTKQTIRLSSWEGTNIYI